MLHIHYFCDKYLVINPLTGMWVVLDDNIYEELKKTVTPFVDEKYVNELFRKELTSICKGSTGINTKSHGREWFSVILQVTLYCNLLCKYCYTNTIKINSHENYQSIKNSEYTVTDKVVEKTLRFLLKVDAKRKGLFLHGGEPLLFKRILEEIIAKARRYLGYNTILGVQTNGTLMDDHIVNIVKSYKVTLGVSLDGPPNINDKMRGNGTGKRVIENILKLKRAEVPVNVITTIGQHNQSFLDKIVIWLQNLGVDSVSFSDPTFVGRGSVLRIDPVEVLRSYKRIVEAIIDGRIKDILIHNIIWYIDNIVLNAKLFGCYRTPCAAGYNLIVVTPTGNVYPCDSLIRRDMYMGNIVIDDVEKILRNEVSAMLLKRDVNSIETCKYCSLRSFCWAGCPANALSKNGSLFSVDTFTCTLNRTIIPYLMVKLVESDKLWNYYVKMKERIIGDLK